VKVSMRVVLATAVVAALSGCASFGPQEPPRYYVLTAASAKPGAVSTPRASTLLVVPTVASTFYETQEIAYSRASGERAYYVFHMWTERPSRRITELLVMRLERERLFNTVATAVSGVRGDLLLNTYLVEFYHDAESSPSRVRISMTAELMDPVARVLLARRVFDQSAPALTTDAPGAVQAFGDAIAAILDDICAWVDALAPR
jgi:cholesterol transport system auxiliary component